jgi:hypothetical protein
MTLEFDSPWLGWNPIEVWMGSSLYRAERHPLDLGFKAGDIRNCSYSAGSQMVAITAEDRSGGGQVLAIHERASRSTRVVLRRDAVLRHALNRAGSMVCYTVPSGAPGSAALYVSDLAASSPLRLVENGVAHASPLSWFPDDTHIAYHTTDAQIEVVEVSRGARTSMTPGEAPAASPDGDRVALRRAGHLVLWHLREEQSLPIGGRREWRGKDVVAGPQWAPDGMHLIYGVTAGLVGKEMHFYVLDIRTGETRKTELRYLSGLLLTDASLRPSEL